MKPLADVSQSRKNGANQGQSLTTGTLGLCTIVDEEVSRMTTEEAKQYVAEHDESQVMNPADLREVFISLAGRAPTDNESKSLWWHICELVQD
jgi:hypothetical protein